MKYDLSLYQNQHPLGTVTVEASSREEAITAGNEYALKCPEYHPDNSLIVFFEGYVPDSVSDQLDDYANLHINI